MRYPRHHYAEPTPPQPEQSTASIRFMVDVSKLTIFVGTMYLATLTQFFAM
jgi:hypothetical protein